MYRFASEDWSNGYEVPRDCNGTGLVCVCFGRDSRSGRLAKLYRREELYERDELHPLQQLYQCDKLYGRERYDRVELDDGDDRNELMQR